MSAGFATTTAEYASLRNRALEVFAMDSQGLPGSVFSPGFDSYRFIEFDVMLFPEFWDVLASCAEGYGDDDVCLLAHEPDAEDYYFANFGRYGALSFPRGCSRRDYKKWLLQDPGNSPADAFQYNLSVGLWCGSSKEWGFWGDRDLGVGVGATRNSEISWPSIEGIEWLDARNALESLVAPNFDGAIIPIGFAKTFEATFGAPRKH